MRRVVIELSGKGLDNVMISPLQKVESLEMVHILKMVPGEFAGIVRIKMKDPKTKVEDIFPSNQNLKQEVELLEQDKNGVSTYFFKMTTKKPPDPKMAAAMSARAYIGTPFEIKNGTARVTFLGTSKQIRNQLRAIEKAVEKLGTHYKIISQSDARFPADSPISRLTDKQRKVLITAYKLGYYHVPKKISSEELARKLGLVKSTFVAHRRKAERRLLDEMLSGF